MGCKVGEKIIIWDSTKYTTDVMSREIYPHLCDKRNRPRTYFENEVKSLIDKGPLTKEQLKYMKCNCLNQSQVKGECRLGACIVIRDGGWSVSINVESVPRGTASIGGGSASETVANSTSTITIASTNTVAGTTSPSTY